MHRGGIIQQRGFTMLELLVAIAMIGLMAALLVPVINKGKRNAQTAYDLNNAKQILMAAHMYCGDNDDYLPQPGWGTSVACWAAAAHIELGGNPTSVPAFTALRERQRASFAKGQLYSYLKNPSLLQCPADNVFDAAFMRRQIYISSYVWNSAILGFPSLSIPVKFPSTYRLRQFRPDAILLWEANENQPFCFNDFSCYPDEGVSARHDGGATIGRFDGSASRFALSDFEAHSGDLANDLGTAGNGWRRARVPAPNLLWCSPVHRGVPESDSGSSP